MSAPNIMWLHFAFSDLQSDFKRIKIFIFYSVEAPLTPLTKHKIERNQKRK